ncbi:hypothetical protein RR48_02777 [Papilio machaon]|uniref:Uncharacterized protein n=1 Tax=Papilio machaon TaxID=76193 RepID=A0A0N0PE52_PAPMA|nr:hypothetical protein RR48_02777 [Papilio machaon]
MNKYNAYMDNIKKSKRIALDLIEDTKDVIETDVSSPIYNKVKLKGTPVSDEFNVPSTSQEIQKKPKEYVKYGKITFNTTAILHHYPQMQNKDCTERCALRKTAATKKVDLNLKDDKKADNNNGVKSIETVITVEEERDSDNNNESTNVTVESKDESKTPVKFAEEKLV